MLLQIQDGATALTLRGGMQKMAAEGAYSMCLALCTYDAPALGPHATTSSISVQAQSRPTSGAMV